MLPLSFVIYHQKRTQITKQKAEKAKEVKQRNIERARKLGIEYLPEMQQQMKKKLKREEK